MPLFDHFNFSSYTDILSNNPTLFTSDSLPEGMYKYSLLLFILLLFAIGVGTAIVLWMSATLTKKEVVERLRNTEERMRRYFESPLIGMATTSPTKQWLEVNDKLCEILGYGREELTQLTWDTMTHEEDLIKEIELFKQVLAGTSEGYSLDKRLIRKDGLVIYVNLSVRCVRLSSHTVDYLVTLIQDETERQQTELRYRRLIDNLKNSFLYVHNPDGIFTYLSPSVTHVLGYSPQENLSHFVDWLTPNPLNALTIQRTHLSVQGLQQPSYEVEVFDKKGNIHRLEVTEVPLFDAQNRVVAIEGIAHDITERQQAEEALRHSEERYRLLAFYATDMISTHDPNGAYLYISPACRTLLGYEPEELLGISPYKSFHPEDLPSIQELHTNFIHGALNNYTGSYRIRRKDGKYIWFETTSRMVRDSDTSDIQEIVAISRDITERKHTQEKLQQANTELNQFKTTLDMTLDGVFLFETQTYRFLYVNQGAMNQVGYAKEELLQMTVFEVIPAFSVKRLQKLLAPLLNGLQPALIFETIYQRKDQQLVQVEVFLQYIQVPGQNSVFVALVRDITERKQAEMKLQQAMQAAEEARKAAEIANQAKSTFLANMSHELRTPLNGILGYTQIFSRDTNLTEKQQQGIQIIHRSGEHLLTLINDILDLSKIEAGKLEIVASEIQFPEFLKNIVFLMRMRAVQKGIAFHYEEVYSPLPAGVRADEKRLRQILLNLLSNAIKFTEQGQVTFRVMYANDQARFEIQDTGMGIPADQLESIFIPFQQLGSHHQKLEGTGLGLSISQRLVETMGGQLQVESLTGKGSLFWFEMRLPKVEHYKGGTSIASPMVVGFQPTGEKKTFTLLVADDLKPNRAFLVNLLSELGFCVLEANHGQEALALAEQRLPEVILTDLFMPLMDGFELARQIRHSATLKDSVIIANSASVFEHHQRQSIEAGCNEFLAKPIRMEELLRILQKYLPIEWVYKKPAVSIEMGTSAMVGPSTVQAQELLDLIRRGNVKRILEKVTQLEHQDAKLSLFAKETKDLAKNFEMSKLRELVERYL